MAAINFTFPLPGTPTAEGNLLSFFVAGTATPLAVYSDDDLSVPILQPIEFNAAGQPESGVIYLSPSTAYKCVYTDDEGDAIDGYPVDNISPPSIT